MINISEFLFKVNFTEQYFKNLPFENFIFEPTTRCKEILKSQNLKFNVNNGIGMLYKIDEPKANSNYSGSYINLEYLREDENLSFVVKLKNSFLLNFAEFNIEDYGNCVYYEKYSKPLPENTDERHNSKIIELVLLRPCVFEHMFSNSEVTGVRLLDSQGQVLKEKKNISLQNEGVYQVSLMGYTPGIYIIEELSEDNVVSNTIYYVDSMLWGDEILGVIEIENSSVYSFA